MTATATNTVDLRDYVDAMFRERQQAFDDYRRDHEAFTKQALDGLHDAANKAAASIDKKFDKVDDARNQQDSLIAALMPRAEAEARIKGVAERSDTQAQNMAETVEAIRVGLERSAYITREFFDRYAKEEADKHARVLDQIGVIYTDISNMKGRSAAWAAAGAIFITIVTVGINVLMRVL